MKLIPYIIVGLIIGWAVFSLILYVKKSRSKKNCADCCGCSMCHECNKPEKINNQN